MADANDRAELNRLYWESSESVAEIADRMEVSRRALYESIDPRPAGVSCPACGTPMGFRNRMALEGRQAECPQCGHQATVDPDAPGEPPTRPADPVEPEPSPGPPARRRPSSSGAGLGAALVTGLGIGALLAWVVKRS